MDQLAPNENWSKFFCEAATLRLDQLEAALHQSFDDPESLDFISARLRSPTVIAMEQATIDGTYEGYLIAKYALETEEFREVASIPLRPAAPPSEPPRYKDTQAFQRLRGDNTDLPEDLLYKLSDDSDARDFCRPLMYLEPWPTHNALWNAMAVVNYLAPADDLPKAPTTPRPPTKWTAYTKRILDLHLKEQQFNVAQFGVAHGKPGRVWSATLNDRGTTTSDLEMHDPSDWSKVVTITTGTRFEKLYSKFGGLNANITDWTDPLANAWADGFLTKIRSLWTQVSTRLDATAGRSGNASSQD